MADPTLPRFSFGVGDRFAREAAAQLAAFEQLAAAGVVAAPVWNKSNREHSFIGSEPATAPCRSPPMRFGPSPENTSPPARRPAASTDTSRLGRPAS